MLAGERFDNSLVSAASLPEDVMRAVLFLASSASDFITGQTLYADGGITATP